MDSSKNLERPAWIPIVDRAIDWPTYDRDYLYFLNLHFNPQEQLVAIRALLKRNEKADEDLRNQLLAIERESESFRGSLAERAEFETIDLLNYSIYQDGTHSMAALGMLAPFIETVFSQCFFAYRERFFGKERRETDHERWQRSDRLQWDCHYHYTNAGRSKDLVKGIIQLAEATGLRAKLPADSDKILDALFAYRNSMFHNGIEWPADERLKFQARISQGKWPDNWFTNASIGNEPWAFYMSTPFIERCFEFADKTLEAFAVLVKEQLHRDAETRTS